MISTKSAVVAGHICLDIIPSLENVAPGKFLKLLQPGLMVQIGPPVFSTGGAVSNTGIALHILGVKTKLIGKVGKDMYGGAIMQILSRHSNNLTSGMIVDPESTSSYTIIISPPGIDRMFLHHPGANNSFSINDIRLEGIQDTTLFHFGYPPVMECIFAEEGRQLTQIFKRVKEMGVTTSLDLCLPDPASSGGQADWLQILANTLPYVDLFLPSIDELLFTIRRQTYFDMQQSTSNHFLDAISPDLLHSLSQDLFNMGAKVVLIKLGERGAYLRTNEHHKIAELGSARPVNFQSWVDQELWAPCFKVNVAGTTGSGDATIAGFLAGLLREMSPEEALTSAVAVGACNVEAPDAISGLRSWDETQARIKAGWERHILQLDSPAWNWDNAAQLWRHTGTGEQ